MVVQAEAILTSLIYDHALRIRMKAEVSNSDADASSGSGVSTVPVPVPGPAPVDVVAEGPLGDQPAPQTKDNKEKVLANKNIVGRLNNLVTTDIQTITRGRDWLLPGAVHPCSEVALN